MVRCSSMTRKALLNWQPAAFRRFIRSGLTFFQIQSNSKRSWKNGEESEADNFQWEEIERFEEKAGGVCSHIKFLHGIQAETAQPPTLEHTAAVDVNPGLPPEDAVPAA